MCGIALARFTLLIITDGIVEVLLGTDEIRPMWAKWDSSDPLFRVGCITS